MGCAASVPAVEHKASKRRAQRVRRVLDSMLQNEGRLLVYGILQRANTRNRNGRVYPKDILIREASRYYDSHVRQGRALGELDHPAPDDPYFRKLNIANVSHQVLDYHWEEDDLVGTVEVLPTTAGNKLKQIYLSGESWPGVSSRGWATLKESDGLVFVLEDFQLITFDFVRDPSTEHAVLKPIPHKLCPLQPQLGLAMLPALVQAHHEPDFNFGPPADAAGPVSQGALVDKQTGGAHARDAKDSPQSGSAGVVLWDGTREGGW